MLRLKDVSDSDLRKELERRKKKLQKEKEIVEYAFFQKVIQFKDVLKSFMKHDRLSCGSKSNSSYHPSHGGAECHLCCLDDLTIEDFGEIDVTIDIKLNQRR
jgi:hypothetical protein